MMKVDQLIADPIDEALAQSQTTFRSPRMIDHIDTDAVAGSVCWKPAKSLWITGMTLTAAIAGPLFFTWSALAIFIVTTAITVCLGHSLGMHRRLIHRSFDCPLWLERLFVYLGTLVGMAGPYGMIRQHDIRDWAQRKTMCHPYLAHRSSIMRDAWWQLHCELKLCHPPRLVLERRVAEDRFYRFLERTWMAQQLPWAVLFFAVGGMPWLVWGVAARVAASVTGHWLVGYFAHNRGPRTWHVEGAGVQGYNVPCCALITMGEAWHNNHHAFPGSARLGIGKGEWDPGWWILRALGRARLVWGVKTPELLPHRPNLRLLGQEATDHIVRPDARKRAGARPDARKRAGVKN
ncbi:MAG TPA: acyl-CoA desaturase [Xanthobacteraceae bacterium]|nr:acyl-CoA desaturase [Xanthobacteraceae bacterium]